MPRAATVTYYFHLIFYLFFFSSRRRHTRFDCDWSSDVCSSDLVEAFEAAPDRDWAYAAKLFSDDSSGTRRILHLRVDRATLLRSEERRVGKECRSRLAPYY